MFKEDLRVVCPVVASGVANARGDAEHKHAWHEKGLEDHPQSSQQRHEAVPSLSAIHTRVRVGRHIHVLFPLWLFDSEEDKGGEHEAKYGAEEEYPAPSEPRDDGVANGKGEAVANVDAPVVEPHCRATQLLEGEGGGGGGGGGGVGET